MKKNIKKILLVILILILAILIAGRQLSPKFLRYLEREKIERENKKTIESIAEENIILTPVEKVPEKAYLEVPFICQAPLETEENWVYHEESCEEAALLQAYLYETKQTMTKEEADKEILNMTAWQKENFGGHYDLYAEDVKKFAIGYYKLEGSEVKIIPNASIDNIKKAISSGHPVIVPITGDILNNPYYPYPGYHMLTVIGYTEDKIITNDNGTRRGKDFSYDIEIFKSAMDDAGGDILILNIN